jgi:hypothetical protein
MDETSVAWGLAAGAFYKLKQYTRGGFWLGGRVAFAMVNEAGGDTSDFALEIPARIQINLGDMMAVHFETGLVFEVAGDGGALFGGGDAIALVGRPFGAGGFTVYWP